jgi:hypothetical protein
MSSQTTARSECSYSSSKHLFILALLSIVTWDHVLLPTVRMLSNNTTATNTETKSARNNVHNTMFGADVIESSTKNSKNTNYQYHASANSYNMSSYKTIYHELFEEVDQLSDITTPNVRYQLGSWIANSWIPPNGWRKYSANELYWIWSEKSIFWVGDSTSRRTALSMYRILNATIQQQQYEQNSSQPMMNIQQRIWKNIPPPPHDDNDDVMIQRALNENLQHTIIQTPRTHISSDELNQPPVIDVNRVFIGEPCKRYNYTLEQYEKLICRYMPTRQYKNISKSNESSMNIDQNFSHSNIITGSNNLDEEQDGYASTDRKEFFSNFGPCLAHVESFFLDTNVTSLLTKVDVIVVAAGVWEVVRRADCQKLNINKTEYEVYRNAIYASAKYQSLNRMVVWRTSGYMDDAPIENSEEIYRRNEMVMDIIDEYNTDYQFTHGRMSNLTYVNWGSAIVPRSFGIERLKGDLKAHYGPDPRVVMVQMLTNHLMDRGTLSPPPTTLGM